MTIYQAFEFPITSVDGDFFPRVLLLSLLVVLVVVPVVRNRRAKARKNVKDSVIISDARQSDIEDEMDARATALQMDRTAYRARSARKVSIYDDRFGS